MGSSSSDRMDLLILQLTRIADALESGVERPTASPPTGGASVEKPRFCGYFASWTTDDRGYPDYLITEHGVIASRHEKQGDVWWSVKIGDDVFQQIVKIEKGSQIPEIARWKVVAVPTHAPGAKAGSGPRWPAGTEEENPGAPPQTSEKGAPPALASTEIIREINELAEQIGPRAVEWLHHIQIENELLEFWSEESATHLRDRFKKRLESAGDPAIA